MIVVRTLLTLLLVLLFANQPQTVQAQSNQAQNSALPNISASLNKRTSMKMNDDWRFYYSWQVGRGEGTTVNLPHTYNHDAMYRNDYFRGLVGYLKYIDVPLSWSNSNVVMNFNGANSVTDLYINGMKVGRHIGGYTRFGWDITKYLRYGERNTIHVRVNNAPSLEIIPIESYMNEWGGIYGDVWLELKPKCAIDEAKFGANGVKIHQFNVGQDTANVIVETTIGCKERGVGDVSLGCVIVDGEGNMVDSMVQNITFSDYQTQVNASIPFEIIAPKLWNAQADPHLYTAKITVQSKFGTDSIDQKFGLRNIKMGSDNKLYINGVPVSVRGVVMHHEWAGQGNVMLERNFDRDMEWIKEMGANAVRVYGRPVDPYFASLCDKEGIMVWSELPFNAPQIEKRNAGYDHSEAFRENTRGMLREMINQGYNNPSIIWWGLYSDIAVNGDDPTMFVKDLNMITKSMDSTRLTAAASSQDGSLNMITDVIGFNPMFGWDSGSPSDIDLWMNQLRKDWQTLPAGLSSYGAGGAIFQSTDTLTRPAVNSNFHPQQWQSHLHEKYLTSIYAPNSCVWGGFVANMFDHASVYARNFPQSGINDMGMVTYDRSSAKEAFYLYKAAWNDQDMFIYMTKPVKGSKSGCYDIKVYSNYPAVELRYADKNQNWSKRAENNGYGIFMFENISAADLNIDATLEVVPVLPDGNAEAMKFLVRDLIKM